LPSLLSSIVFITVSGFRFDADRSNTIDCNEFINLLEYLHSSGAVRGGKMSRENALATFKVLDGNSDGRLTRQVKIAGDCDDGASVRKNCLRVAVVY
jgi:hypothetical protein